MPLRSQVGKPSGQRSGPGGSTARTERTAGAPDPASDTRLPDVTSGTTPPHLLVGECGHLARVNIAVAAGVPFSRHVWTDLRQADALASRLVRGVRIGWRYHGRAFMLPHGCSLSRPDVAVSWLTGEAGRQNRILSAPARRVEARPKLGSSSRLSGGYQVGGNYHHEDIEEVPVDVSGLDGLQQPSAALDEADDRPVKVSLKQW